MPQNDIDVDLVSTSYAKWGSDVRMIDRTFDLTCKQTKRIMFCFVLILNRGKVER